MGAFNIFNKKTNVSNNNDIVQQESSATITDPAVKPLENTNTVPTTNFKVEVSQNKNGNFECEEVDVINLHNLSQSFKTSNGTFNLFDNFNLDIKDFKNVGQFVSIMGQSGCGKCVSGDTYVRLKDKIVKIKDIVKIRKPDSSIEAINEFAIINNNNEKISHYYYGGIKPTKKVSLENGDTLEGTFVHPVKVWRNFEEVWINMENLMVNDFLLKDNHLSCIFENIDEYKLPNVMPSMSFIDEVIEYNNKHKISQRKIGIKFGFSQSKVSKILNHSYKRMNFTAPKLLTTDIAYFLGLLCGDGTISKKFIGITTCDDEIENFLIRFSNEVLNVDSSVYHKKNSCVRTICPLEQNHLRDWFKLIGLKFGNATSKEVPYIIKNAPFIYQKHFVIGLMDSDGSVDFKNHRAEISLNSYELINFVKEVISCLGMEYKLKKRKKSFRLTIKKNNNINELFRLNRKKITQEYTFDYSQSYRKIPGSFNYIKRLLEGKENIKISANFKQFLRRGNDCNRYAYYIYKKELNDNGIFLKDLPNYNFVKIISIENSENEVFDLCNPTSHSFIANGYLVHNTQLLKVISGLNKPQSGSVKIYGKEQTDKDAIPMVFQQYSSFPWMSVLDNIALPLKMKGVSKSERTEKAMEMVKIVGLEGHENKWAQYPILSGGQLQRVSIGRALIANSQILLLDEFSSGLDIRMKREIQDTLLDVYYNSKLDPTVINVTHDILEAVYCSNRIYILSANPCKIHTVIDIDFGVEKRTYDLRETQKFKDYVSLIEKVMSEINN